MFILNVPHKTELRHKHPTQIIFRRLFTIIAQHFAIRNIRISLAHVFPPNLIHRTFGYCAKLFFVVSETRSQNFMAKFEYDTFRLHLQARQISDTPNAEKTTQERLQI